MDKIKNSESYCLKRIESKNAKNAIIQKLSQDFNLTPNIAEAFCQQFYVYFSEHSNISLSSIEVSYEAVYASESAGKHIRLSYNVTCRLKLMDINSDFEVLTNFGLAGMRRLRIERLTRQAYDQQNFSQQQIHLIAQKSDRLVREYIQLYDIYYKLDNKLLLELISPEPAYEGVKKIQTSISHRR